MVLTPILVAGRVGGSVRGVASTVRSLEMSPELSVGDVGKASVSARLAPELSVGGVEICALQDEGPLTWLTSRFSVREADGGAWKLFATVLQSIRVDVG